MKTTKKNNIFVGSKALSIYSSLICIVVASLIGLIVLISISPSDAFPEFITMMTGGLQYSGIDGFISILNKSAPLICVGLSILFALKSGFFNIGVAGQYVFGAFVSLVSALIFKQNWFVCMLLGTVAGALWGFIPGMLKAFFNVNEVIGGIMLNWIALFITNHCFQTVFSDALNMKMGGKTYDIKLKNPSALIPQFKLTGEFGTDFSIIFIIAIIVVIAIHIIINKTTFGYALRASGLNKSATKYAGMNEKKNIVSSLVISGALAGLGASLYYLSATENWLALSSSSLPAVPWNGIVVAFMAQLNPIGVIFASLFSTMISEGASQMTQTIFPGEFGSLVTGIIIYLSGLVSLVKLFIEKKILNKGDK